jgi:hypothetical protein
MSPDAFKRGMAVLAEAFPQRQLTAATLGLYREMLADLADEEWERAVKLHVRTGKFFPSVAELVAHAKPAPTVADVGQLFARVELRAATGRSFAQIEHEFGPGVARAILAIGGIVALRRLDDPTERAFALKGFTAALAEEHRDTIHAPFLGPAQDRIAHLVKQTGKVLQFPAPARGKAS